MLDTTGAEIVRPAVDGWAVADAPAANTAATATKAAPADGRRHRLRTVTASITGGTPAASLLLEVKDGSTTVWQVKLPAAGVFTFDLGEVAGTANGAVSATLPAGGASISGVVALTGFTL